MPRPHPAPLPQKAQELAARYTLEHCKELLEMSPEGVHRLFQISREQPVKTLYAQRKSRAVLPKFY